MEFEYWSGEPFPSPGDLPSPGMEPRSSTLQVDSLPAEPQGKPKNTGVGSLSLLQRIFPTRIEPGSPALQADSLPAEPQAKPKNTGVGSLSLLQGIFLTQESNWVLPHCRPILYQLRYQGSLRILEWVAYPFSSGSSRPRNQTGVSCITGEFFNN